MYVYPYIYTIDIKVYVYPYIRHPFIRVLENVNVLLFAFNRVVNVAHVHVHGVHHLFSHVCGPGAGRGVIDYFFPMCSEKYTIT